MRVVDAIELGNYHFLRSFQPLERIPPLGICEGGDPWK